MKELPQHRTVTYYYKNKNNNKYQQGRMNISEDITIKKLIKQN